MTRFDPALEPISNVRHELRNIAIHRCGAGAGKPASEVNHAWRAGYGTPGGAGVAGHVGVGKLGLVELDLKLAIGKPPTGCQVQGVKGKTGLIENFGQQNGRVATGQVKRAAFFGGVDTAGQLGEPGDALVGIQGKTVETATHLEAGGLVEIAFPFKLKIVQGATRIQGHQHLAQLRIDRQQLGDLDDGRQIERIGLQAHFARGAGGGCWCAAGRVAGRRDDGSTA